MLQVLYLLRGVHPNRHSLKRQSSTLITMVKGEANVVPYLSACILAMAAHIDLGRSPLSERILPLRQPFPQISDHYPPHLLSHIPGQLCITPAPECSSTKS